MEVTPVGDQFAYAAEEASSWWNGIDVIDMTGMGLTVDQQVRAQRAYEHDVLTKAYSKADKYPDNFSAAIRESINEVKQGDNWNYANSIIRPYGDDYTGPGNYDFSSAPNEYGKISRIHDLEYMAAQYADTVYDYNNEIARADEKWFNSMRDVLSKEKDVYKYNYYNTAMVALLAKGTLGQKIRPYPEYRGRNWHPAQSDWSQPLRSFLRGFSYMRARAGP